VEGTGTQFRVVITDQVFPDVDIERQLIEAAGGELVVARDRDDALRLVEDADALLTTYMPIDADVMKKMRRVKIIARYGIGVDNIDVAAARSAGIAVTNVPDYCVEEVATHTVALMLALVRKIPQSNEIVRSGGWGVRQLGELQRFSKLTVGVIGFGRIAQRVAVAVEALGARMLIHDPYLSSAPGGRPLVSLQELFQGSNIVTVHCPLTPETRGLVNENVLRLMPPASYLVNTSRGPIVDTSAVTSALARGHLAGAALDVLEQEPPDLAALVGVPNLVLTPHSAFLSTDSVRESQRKATTQVLKALQGQPLDYSVG